MAVIAMTREMGTLGKDVAAQLAERLGLEVIHHELVEQHVARRLELGESAVHRFLEGKPQLWERWKIDAERLSRYTAEEILSLALKGNVVIRGWGAAQLLRDVSHVVCVRICAPFAKRTTELMRRLEIKDRALAEREIRMNDDAHTRAVQRQLDLDWRDPQHYDVVLNTGFVPIGTCVALIAQLASDPAYQPTDASRRALLDKLVQAKARSLLGSAHMDLPTGTSLDVAVKEGVMTISGVTGTVGGFDAVIAQLRQIDGVTEVRNEVIRVAHRYGP